MRRRHPHPSPVPGQGEGLQRDRFNRRRFAVQNPRGGQRKADPEGPHQARLKVSPDLVVVHTQPGLEGIAIREALARIPGAREAGRRSIAERNGMALIAVDRPQELARLRCPEDLFALAAYARPVATDREGLEQARKVARNAPFIEAALARRVAVTPGSRSGHRLDFRVVVRTTGQHDYRRVDLQKAIERGIAERGDRRWRPQPDGDVEFWATLLDDELLLTVRLTDDRMRQREYKAAHFPGSLRPSVAAAMGLLSQPTSGDVVLDPLCGAGTILIERAHIARYRMLLGGDSNPQALEAARENVGQRYKPIELRSWDAAALPIAGGEVTRIITNLPWGRKSGSHGGNRTLYPRLLREFRRVLAPGGLMVLMTSEARLMRELFEEHRIVPGAILTITVLGAPASIYVCRFGAA